MTSKKAELIYETPLGEISGYLDYSGSLESLAEVEVCEPNLPAHMKISECRVFKWKIKTTEDRSSFKAVCEFKSNLKMTAEPHTGEWLDCLQWENENYILNLATDDGEYLNFRAGKNIIPQRFATKHPDGLIWVNYTDNCLDIEVPDLRKNEHIELRFSAAWKAKEKMEDNASTWYAVDVALHN